MILAYKGKVDEWRLMRNGFYLIHCSLVEKKCNIVEAMPLPFDDELQEEKGSTEDLLAEYNRLKESGALD